MNKKCHQIIKTSDVNTGLGLFCKPSSVQFNEDPATNHEFNLFAFILRCRYAAGEFRIE